MKPINVIGLGYIGLPTALAFASHGVPVVGSDINQKVVDTLNAGKTTFEEKGLNELFQEALAQDIRFQTDYIATEVYIVSVPTPYDQRTKQIQLDYVVAAVEDILDICPQGARLVIESTLSPSSIDRYVRPALHARGKQEGKDIHLVHAPERILPGNMIHELIHNSRTIGADDPKIGQEIKEIYQSFCQAEIVVTDIKTAEMTKVVENTYRDINIAFANELQKICRVDDMDVQEIIRIANMHPRVNILSPGPGVGGHCISVDPWFLVGDYPEESQLILTARQVNDSMPSFVLERASEIMEEEGLEDPSRVGLYGLTYKENVDDTRESPTLQLLEAMKKSLASGLKVYDPFIKEDLLDQQYHDFDAFLEDLDMVIIMVAHDHIKENLDKLSDKIVLDTKRISKGDHIYYL